jgi:hypothetical protein
VTCDGSASVSVASAMFAGLFTGHESGTAYAVATVTGAMPLP